MRRQSGAKADRDGFTEEVGKIWEGREEGGHGGTVVNMNKGLDTGVGHVSSPLMEKPVGPEHRMVEGTQDGKGN